MDAESWLDLERLGARLSALRRGGASHQPGFAEALRASDVVAREASGRVLARLEARCAGAGPSTSELLYETLYREQQRLSESAPTPADAADRAFLERLRSGLRGVDERAQAALLRQVVERYAGEIRGHFDPRVYDATTRVLPSALAALLHGGRPSRELFSIDDRVLLEGEVDAVRAAARRGTVVLVPTHFSNLDSLILGYAIFRLGLPPFAYGAGLNLFSNPLMGFFMDHLGAFTVDRKKSDPLYRETVKEYASVLLERGQHMLFFPGGTRSRSGALESRLKLGFLSRVITAYARRKLRDPGSAPLYVVPCTLSYPLVLEADSLIGEYLRREGGPRFVDVRDESAYARRWLAFLRGLSELDVRVHVRFAMPRDPFGNVVDADGASRDGSGRVVDPARYLWVDGAVVEDAARDAEYTRTTAAAVLDCYRRDTVVLPSSVLAFCVFARLRRAHPELTLFRFLRGAAPGARVPLAPLVADVKQTLAALQELAGQGRCVLDPALRGEAGGSVHAVLDDGRRTLATYHRDPPVLTGEGATMIVTHPALLLYYRNRLAGLGLPGDFGADVAHPRRSTP